MEQLDGETNSPIPIHTSNGASDYGNKLGEPMIQGYTMTFGMRLPIGEWLKPIMFSACIGQIDHTHITKGEPKVGMLVVKICRRAYILRDRLSMAVLGTINGEGRCTLIDSTIAAECKKEGLPPHPPAVDLELEKVLGDMPKKTFEFNRVSYRFLTTKVDRCVTGLVAQQQTVGLFQITLADVAVIAQTFTDLTGGACAIGEQPIKGMLDPKSMARLAVGEALTNLVWEKVIALSDVKAKLEGDGSAIPSFNGIAIDGEVVKASGNCVISAYVTCPDITKTVTPDLKLGDDGVLLHVDLAKGKRRLGGSALAQVFGQIGNDCLDVDDVPYFKNVFEGVQALISEDLLSAGHDIIYGGLVVKAMKVAFAGNRGINLNLDSNGINLFETLFSEELGLVMEISNENLDDVLEKLSGFNVSAEIIGKVTESPLIEVKVDGITHLSENTSFLRAMWEDTSFQLEKMQRLTNDSYMSKDVTPKVAVIREEGSNGDREMSAAFHAAGFEPWDVTVSDLLAGAITLDQFRGIVCVGGFSYADVLDSAKGWDASIRIKSPLLSQFQEFYKRPNSSVSESAMAMTLLEWVPDPEVGGSLDTSQPRFVHNESGRFECKFTSVTIKDSPSIMLKGMEGSTLGTEAYPFYLNGSLLGIAAICSPDGRYLAMMPHPERCFLMWQFPWYPKSWEVEKAGPTPWLKMFQNARDWCSQL
ncbi:LOW QUALITY PROTEIN: hypothetical protein N665_0169s0024 [Sinapis alba]|nr:LOW QUALITY PROTEIN: hypothetical protein N665_0169s0024 [Sinapis alba]